MTVRATGPRTAGAEAAGAHSAGAHDECAHTAALAAVRSGRTDLRRRLVWALGITVVFMAAEVVGGLVANSLALLADAGHMLTDAGALGLALAVASWNVRRPDDAPARHERREAWAAAVNAVILLAVSGGIITEALTRFQAPESVDTGLMLVVAALGLLVNIGAALLLRPAVSSSLNARGAYLHVLGDLLGSVGTIAAALIIQQRGYLLADPIASMLVCLLVVGGAIRLGRDALRVLRKQP